MQHNDNYSPTGLASVVPSLVRYTRRKYPV